jgi:PEP-CTERM motif
MKRYVNASKAALFYFFSSLSLLLITAPAFAGPPDAIVPNPNQGTWQTTLLGRDIQGYAVDGSDPSAVFLYDTDLNITWLRNADIAGGEANWNESIARINYPNILPDLYKSQYGGFTGWRMPDMPDYDPVDPGSIFSFGGTLSGYNVDTSHNEMAHLFYVSLGNKARYTTDFPLTGIEQTGYGLTNTGDFLNMKASKYWAGTQYSSSQAYKWTLDMRDGGVDISCCSWFTMAVRDGDVLVSSVPEPETYAMMLVGLGVMVAIARRRKAKQTENY